MKKLLACLLALILCIATLSASALELTELPSTFAELQTLVPEMPDLTPQGLAFYIPTYDELMAKSRGFEFICDQEAWSPVRVTIGNGGVEFVYDDAAGAYIVEEKFFDVQTSRMMMGMMDSMFLIASTDEVSDWTLNVGFYFDTAFAESVLFRNGEITQPDWLNVAETGDTCYFMPNVIAQYPLDNGYLQIWLYATKTIAVIRDSNAAVIASQTYPEASEWCNTFMPTFQ